MELKDFGPLWNAYIKALRKYKMANARPMFGEHSITIRSLDSYAWRARKAHTALLEAFPSMKTQSILSNWRHPTTMATI